MVRRKSEEKIQEGMSLEKLYEEMIKEQTQRDDKAAKEKDKRAKEQQKLNMDQNIQVVNSEMYKLMMQFHPEEFNIFNILCLTPNGLTLYDLIRITNMTKDKDALPFGKWDEFLSKIFNIEKLEKSETMKST